MRFPRTLWNGYKATDVCEDGDGWGDNADPDDDNDGVHLGQDIGLVIQFERFTLFDAVDWFSNTGDMYFCYSIYNQSDVCLHGNGAFTVSGRIDLHWCQRIHQP